jgi:predicted dehydrogenase
LLEKPMTLTAAEAEELQKLAERKKLELLISCPWHYTPHSVEARRLIRSGALGKIKMISVLMTNFTLGLYQGKPWNQIFGDNATGQNAAAPYMTPGLHSYSDPSIAGGGQIYCQVSHVAAHLNFLTGGRLSEVFARFDNGGTQVDVYDALSLKLDDGTLVSVASNGATMPSERNYEVRIYGEEGMLLLELWKGTMAWHNRRGEVKSYPDLGENEIYPMFAPAENFVDVMAGKAANGSPGSTGVFAMQVIEASIASAKERRNIVLGT